MSDTRQSRNPLAAIKTTKVAKGYISLHDNKGEDGKSHFAAIKHVQQFAKIGDIVQHFEASDKHDAKKLFDEFIQSYQKANATAPADKLTFARDSQRAKVQEFMDSSSLLRDLRREKMSAEDARDLIQKICEESGVSPIKSIRLVDNNRQKTVSYTAEMDEFLAPISNLDTASVLFWTSYAVNLKRHIQPDGSKVDVAPHGPEFVSEFIRIMDRYTATDAIELVGALQDSDIAFSVVQLLKAFRDRADEEDGANETVIIDTTSDGKNEGDEVKKDATDEPKANETKAPEEVKSQSRRQNKANQKKAA